MIGCCCPELAKTSNWTEQHDDQEIDQGDAELTLMRSMNDTWMGDSDAVVLSGLMWKFQHPEAPSATKL